MNRVKSLILTGFFGLVCNNASAMENRQALRELRLRQIGDSCPDLRHVA
jgi:hypothetical protein